jgi:cytochrome c-type biogenesis protein CcmH
MAGAGPVDWLPGLAFLAAGLALGAFFVWRVRAGKRAPPVAPAPPALDVRDLIGRREALVQQLRELEDTAAKRNPEQLAVERYSLELETARVLMQLDARSPAAPLAEPEGAAKASGPGFLAARPALRGFLWGAAGTGVLGLLLFFAAQTARPRGEGGSMTGDVPMASPSQGASLDAEEADLRAALAKNPEDLEARLALARLYLTRQDMMAVWTETQAVLAKSPDNARALSYQSLVRLAMGQGDVAVTLLKRSLAADPNQLEPYLHMSLVYAKLGRPKESDAALDEALRRFPDQAPLLRQVRQQIRSVVADAPAATADTDPHASVPPPGGPRRQPSTPATNSGGSRVAGVVDVDASLQGQIPAGTVVFVSVREAGFGAGPPFAAKRLTATSFPLSFEITDADSMRGDPLPKELLLEARADPDGDPMTRSPQDPAARVDDVKTGTTDVRLVLKRR